MDNSNNNNNNWNLPMGITMNQLYNNNIEEMDILDFANSPNDFFQNNLFGGINIPPQSLSSPKNNNNQTLQNTLIMPSKPIKPNSLTNNKTNNQYDTTSTKNNKRNLNDLNEEKTNKKNLGGNKKILSEDEKEKSRNASRDYRKRKKEYMESLEKKVSNLENEVKKLIKINEEQAKNLERERDHKKKFEIGRKYHEEWSTSLIKLEYLLNDTKDKDADQKIYSIIENMKILFERILHFYKDQYISQLDFSVFAHFSLFVRDSYHFESYGDDTNLSIALLNTNPKHPSTRNDSLSENNNTNTLNEMNNNSLNSSLNNLMNEMNNQNSFGNPLIINSSGGNNNLLNSPYQSSVITSPIIHNLSGNINNLNSLGGLSNFNSNNLNNSILGNQNNNQQQLLNNNNIHNNQMLNNNNNNQINSNNNQFNNNNNQFNNNNNQMINSNNQMLNNNNQMINNNNQLLNNNLGFSEESKRDERYQVNIVEAKEEADGIVIEEDNVMGMKEIEMNIWLRLTDGLNVSQQVMLKLKNILTKLRENVLKLKLQHTKINNDLSLFIKTEMGDPMKDVGKIVVITSKLGSLQKNYFKYWFVWLSSFQEIHSIFTPKQLAQIWIRKSKFVENCSILNSIWTTLNRQTFSNLHTFPTYIPPLPLPVHLSWQFTN